MTPEDTYAIVQQLYVPSYQIGCWEGLGVLV
jgi:hypothetical protein